MIEMLIGLVKQGPFEIVSTVATVAALVYAARAHKIARLAIQATNDYYLTELRLRVQEGVSNATRDQLRLEELCRTSLIEWDKYFEKHHPTLGHKSRADAVRRRIDSVMGRGEIVLKNLNASAPTTETEDAAALEDFIRTAQSASIEIQCLGARLERPTEYYE